MEQQAKVEIKYLPRHCPFLDQEVWAVLAQQSDKSWRIVNCLDKHGNCFNQPCAFTATGGQWPFAEKVVAA